jgi:two-component system sensor histidine kinase KdpD
LVVIAALAAESSTSLMSAPSLTLVFLVAVVVSARRYGLWPAIFTSVLSVMCWDFFFTLPYYTLYMSNPRDVVALVVFLIVSLIVGGMTAQIRRQNEQLASQAESVSWLYRLSQEVSRLPTVDKIASFAASRIADAFKAEAVIFLKGHDSVDPLVFPAGITLTPDESAAAERAWSAPDTLGRTRAGRYDFLPLKALQGYIGSVGIAGPASLPASREERQKLDAILNQVAIAIERAWLAHDIEHARMGAETERLRNALLTSVSHDLRTPLTAIIGALTTIESAEEPLDAAVRSELIATARSEAERLNRFVGNLLDVTRLESGNLRARLVPTDIADVVETVLERGKSMLADHVVEVALPDDLPSVSADFTLLEQALFNLLDNAAKYSPAHTKIRISAAPVANEVVIDIADEGPGIPEGAQERIFEKFTRFALGDKVPPGTGLGLMICRGFLKSMNGAISVSAGPHGRGAVFSIWLDRA